METEPLHKPTVLRVFELNAEFQPRVGGKFRFRTVQLIETSLNCFKQRKPLVRALHAAVINLSREILPKLSSQTIRRFLQRLR